MNTKKRILEILEKNRGQYISGEYMANQLNISRNAVWKSVRDLKASGYKVDSATNKGYCLSGDNDVLSAEGMLPFLEDKSLVNKITVYNSLESTNKTAKELALAGAGDNTVIIADHQTMGKGRYGRSFYSPPGHGIYMSLILYPKDSYLKNPTLVTTFAAVAVCRAIEAVSEKKPKIKWVNDIFLDGKKISGILTEAVSDFESGSLQWIVAGIGINFQLSPDFPDELSQIVGSIFSGNPPVTRNQLAAEVLNQFISAGKHTSQEELLREYKERLFILGKKITVVGINTTYPGTAVDINNMGHLIVKTDNGEIRSLSSGEISIKIN